MSLPAFRIRIACDIAKVGSGLANVQSGGTPTVWRGNDIQFEIGIFFMGKLVTPDNLVSVRIDVKPENDRTATALMNKIASGADLNLSLTQEQWDQGTSQHAKLLFAKAETNLDFTGATNNQKNYWMVISAETNDTTPREITLGGGVLSMVEDGAGGALVTPTPGPPTSYTKEEIDAKLNGVMRAVNPNGFSTLLKNKNGHGILIYVDDNDNSLRQDYVAP